VDARVNLGERDGAANAGRKVMTLVWAMALGADCIDDCDVLRSGRGRAARAQCGGAVDARDVCDPLRREHWKMLPRSPAARDPSTPFRDEPDAMTGRSLRALLALPAAVLLACAGLGGSAQAQAPSPAPSLQVTEASVHQVGGDLQFGLRFNRALPVAELRAAGGRSVCVVLSPLAASRRRACVSRRHGRLSATLARIDEGGVATGPPRVLRGARIVARGGFLALRVAATELRVTLGRVLQWRAYVQWHEAAGCALSVDPAPCVQLLPAEGVLTYATRPPRGAALGHRHRLRLLATGDSMIQIIDGDLARRLAPRAGASVRSDAHIGSGITKPGELDWPRRARAQASAYKPDVTVMFLGANDGFDLRSAGGARAPCCGAAWVAAYARRVAAMMRTYRRGGRSAVYWLTLPAPRPASFARIYPRVNAAIKRAAARVGDGVRVIDLVPVFTPGGRFRQTITFRGQTIDARQPDRVHLSAAGASVAATLIIDRLRADLALP
jgi:lysophospholipase L1-like esterase